MPEANGLNVVKVGGSLFDLPDLGARLQRFVTKLGKEPLLLVAGGGHLVQQIRLLDETHRLGERKAHDLALAALSVTARFLCDLLPAAVVIDDPQQAQARRVSILDPARFCREQGDAFPASWELTSDSIALAAALVMQARGLILLKSIPIPADMSWQIAAQRGLVDRYFPRLMATAPQMLKVEVIDFRA